MACTRFPTVAVNELLAKGLVADAAPPPLVLVVDDEAMIVDTLAAILEKEGFATATAYAGNEALEVARLAPPDLLLSDVLMPDMDGIELATQVAELSPDCQILLLSAQSLSADLLAGSGVRRDRFKILQKPLHPGILLAEVSQMMRQRSGEIVDSVLSTGFQPTEKAKGQDILTRTDGH